MGRPKGHPGPVKPEEEKMDKIVRVGFTSGEKNLLINRAASLNLTVSRYIRTLFVADITKNG